MQDDGGSSSPPPFPWPWFVAIVLCAMATGVGFGISVPLGLVLAVTTAVVIASFMVSSLRSARRRRAAGNAPDLSELQRRLRRHLRWHVPFAFVTVALCLVALAARGDDTPVWIIVVPAVLVLFGIGQMWFLTERLLPRIQRKQASRSQRERTD